MEKFYEISKALTLPGKIFGCANCEGLRMKSLWASELGMKTQKGHD